jgi:nucleotide-binding universal stress UspA family protein
MFNCVLLTVDLNRPGSWQKALPQAVKLSHTSKTKLHTMSVVPDMGTSLVEGFFPEDFNNQAVASASKAPDNLAKKEVSKDVAVKQHLTVVKIHRKVSRTIEEIECDLVVMVLHKLDRVREFLVGSNADGFMRRSPVSVLVVRA